MVRAEDGRQTVAVFARQGRGGQLDLADPRRGVIDSDTPSAGSSRVRIAGDSGLARAGSPQAFQAIGGNKALSASDMGYSITDVVNQ